MLKIGIAGLGFMGWIHYLAYKRTEKFDLKAFMAIEPERREGDWTKIQGNFGPPGEKVDVSNLAVYAELDELFADETLDAVDICLPPFLHRQAAIAALNAGKHVFLEKPMALRPDHCEEIVAAAKSVGKQILVGHVLPFFAEYTYARQIIDSGDYGKLIGGTFKRVISDPQWLTGFYDPDRVGGPLLDLHIHDAHFIRMLFGMPKRVTSTGRMRGEVVSYCQSQFEFEDEDVVVSSTGGVIDQQGRPFTHGYEIHLEKATIHFEFAAFADEGETMPLKLVDDQGKVIRPELPASDEVSAFAAELNEVADSIANNQTSPILDGMLARDAVIMCQKQTESVKSGAPVSF